MSGVLFSCKITNAVLSYLEDQGEDLTPLYEVSPIPLELMRDPSYWLSAPSMESFLETVIQLPLKSRGPDFLKLVGHNGPQILAWGVLDSVLRMMPRPQEIFNQPARFLSYFISPEPPIENLVRTENSLAFDLPLPAEQYPLVSHYLKAAFESLPVYVGSELAICEWNDIHLDIHWQINQSTLFEKDNQPQISPGLVQNIVDELQKNQKELEEKNRELMKRNEELLQIQKDISSTAKPTRLLTPEQLFESMSTDNPSIPQGPIFEVSQNLARLHDYMVRAQQLITLLLAQSKPASGVKDVLKKIDWDYVKAQYPRTISESVEALRTMQSRSKYSSLKNKNEVIARKEESPHV